MDNNQLINPSIYPFGMRIDEPVTTITDVLVGVVCFVAWYRLNKLPQQHNFISYFKSFFMLMGWATIIGGVIGHGFLYLFSFYWKLPGWLLSMLSITFLERVMIEYSSSMLKPKAVRFFKWFNIVELLIFAGLAFGTLQFKYVEFHSAYGLLVVVLGFCIFNFFRGNRASSLRTFSAAVFLCIVAAVIFNLRIAWSEWFTHADISHILMAWASYLFYRGARLNATEEKFKPVFKG